MLIDRDSTINILVANSLATHFNINKEDDYEVGYADGKKYMIEHIKNMILSLPFRQKEESEIQDCLNPDAIIKMQLNNSMTPIYANLN